MPSTSIRHTKEKVPRHAERNLGRGAGDKDFLSLQHSFKQAQAPGASRASQPGTTSPKEQTHWQHSSHGPQDSGCSTPPTFLSHSFYLVLLFTHWHGVLIKEKMIKNATYNRNLAHRALIPPCLTSRHTT